MNRRFLTAEWRYLLMINFEVDPALVQPLVPVGTELDFWNGKTFLSLVGFRFLRTRVLGCAIPFHTNFNEINLRFYVRRQAEDGWRRGVVFIKDIAPLRAVTLVARWVYNENYVTCKMRHHLQVPEQDSTGTVTYSWQGPSRWNTLSAEFGGALLLPKAGSEEEFITEHYWGYTRQRDGSTMEYRVTHPQWRIWPTVEAAFACGVAEFYGPQYAGCLTEKPSSAFVVDGSAIEVYQGAKIKPDVFF